jgi:hypothetical protein
MDLKKIFVVPPGLGGGADYQIVIAVFEFWGKNGCKIFESALDSVSKSTKFSGK